MGRHRSQNFKFTIEVDVCKKIQVKEEPVIRFNPNNTGWMSNMYSLEQDPGFKLIIPNRDLSEEDIYTYIPDSGDETLQCISAESAIQIQRFFYKPEKKSESGNSDLLGKYFIYRDIMNSLAHTEDVLIMANQKQASQNTEIRGYIPEFRIGAPEYILKLFSEKTLSEVIREFQGSGVVPRPDWDEVREDIAYFVMFSKFEQNPELANRLRKTVGKKIISKDLDSYWSIGYFGLNKLGYILESIRTELLLTESILQRIK